MLFKSECRVDKCLQNPYRKWSLEDLIEEVSQALYEYEGKENLVSLQLKQEAID